MATTGVLLLALGGGRLGPFGFTRALLAVLMTQIATGALNDYIDRERDARTQPEKPIPSGEVTAAYALALVGISLILYIPLAAAFGSAPFMVLSIGLLGGLSYDLWLKPTPFSPIAYIVGFLSLATWAMLITDTFQPRIIVVYPAAALLITSAHIAQSLPDIESDQVHGLRGLAAVLGPVASLRLLRILTSIAAVAGLGLGLVTRDLFAIALVSTGGALAAGAVAIGLRAPYDRARRLAVFHAVAPAIALLAIGSILAARSLLTT